MRRGSHVEVNHAQTTAASRRTPRAPLATNGTSLGIRRLRKLADWTSETESASGTMRLFSGDATGAGYGPASAVLSPLINTSDGLRPGPTGTTPTFSLTPTTLRSIEESLMDGEGGPSRPAPHRYQAGFVTPQVTAGVTFSQLDQYRWQGGVTTVTAGRAGGGPSLMAAAARPAPQGHRRGGRRPKDDAVSPEEEHRRRMRRERNKQAAARCRQRRVTLTNTLQAETDDLEMERSALEQEIRELQAQKEELHFLMESHRPCCRLGKENEPCSGHDFSVKQEPAEEATVPERPQYLTQAVPQTMPQTVPQTSAGLARQARPTSLSLVTSRTGPGVAINTPSHGLGLNFDSLMEGGTGLTPVTSSAGLVPLLPTAAGAALATPVVSQGELRRADMLSPGDRQLVSL